MARIVCVSKYPPLEGGIAAKTFWMSMALAELGHNVHIITDKKNINSEYSAPIPNNLAEKINVHRPKTKIPWHIPNDPHQSLMLLNTTLDVVEQYGADVIDTGYLIPYGLVGYLAGQITGIPFLLRHGGSDLNKFVDAGILKYLASKALATASAIITDKKNYERFFEFSKHVVAIPPYVPNPAFFKSAVNKKIRPTLALIGKANYYWRHKGWHRAIKIMKNLGDRFHYLVISQGVGLIDFKNYVEDQIDFPIEWRCFVHPFEIPQLFQTISGIFILQKDLPFPVFSNLVMEALFCNVTVITDTYDMAQTLKEYDLHINADSRHVLVIPVDQPDKAAKIIINYFEHGVPEPLHIGQREYDHAAYIQKNEDTILSVIKSC